MADEKPRYPMLSTTHWWALRNKFKQTIPSVLNASIIASFLSMTEDSARKNVIPNLKLIGLIDNECRVNNSLATRIRDDVEYSKACKDILESVYPAEVRESFPDAKTENANIKRWFLLHTKLGGSAVGKITAFYLLLASGNPIANTVVKKGKLASKPPILRRTPAKESIGTSLPIDGETEKRSATESNGQTSGTGVDPNIPQKQNSIVPEIHVNVQIHISPESSPEQVEQIFASMAKHFKALRES